MKKLRNYVMCLRSARSVGFSEVFGPLTRGSFCTAVFPTPHPCDLNSGFLKRWGNWGGYRGIAKKRSGRQAFFLLSLPCTAFELASLVLPQRVLGTRAPCLQVRPKPTNWLSLLLWSVWVPPYIPVLLTWKRCPNPGALVHLPNRTASNIVCFGLCTQYLPTPDSLISR